MNDNKLIQISKEILTKEGISFDEVISAELEVDEIYPGLVITYKNKKEAESLDKQSWEDYENSSWLKKRIMGKPTYHNLGLHSGEFAHYVNYINVINHLISKS